MENSWQEKGFLVVPAIFDSRRIMKLREIFSDIRECWLSYDPLSGLPGGDASFETCMRHVNHPYYFANKKETLRYILEICAEKKILEVLRQCFGEEPMFRSTSLFFNPTILQQDGNWHRDTQFVYKDIASEREVLTRYADQGGDGIQIQLPLFDNKDLEYIPGTHRRWDTDEEFHVRLSEGESHCREQLLSSSRIAALAGDAVLFDPNGIHRGRYYAQIPRLTLMITYTRSSVAPTVDRFSYQPWFLEKDYLDGLSEPAKKVYKRFIEHYREAWAISANSLGRLHSGRRS